MVDWHKLMVAVVLAAWPVTTEAAQSLWVHPGPAGKLIYHSSPRGDRIMNFSYAGYRGGGVPIPNVQTRQTVRPSGHDDSALIQRAIRAVSALPLIHGFRGAVLLAPGVFNCRHSIDIRASGVVLRGSGEDSTTIRMIGPPHLCINIAGGGKPKLRGRPLGIANRYIPCGTMWLDMHSVRGLAAGDAIMIRHPITPRYIHFMGMDKLFRNGRQEHWVSGAIDTLRRISAINGKRIKLNAPLTDSINPRFVNPPGAAVVRCDISSQIDQVGLEDFKIISPAQHGPINRRHNGGIRLNAVRNAWLKNISIINTVGAISAGGYTAQITINHINILHTAATSGAALPADFSIGGTQILVANCTDRGDHLFYYVTGARATGPNVLLHCVFYGNGSIMPHQRWATGLLVDQCRVPQGSIELINRGEMGSGHGWAIGWGVAWNCIARVLVIQNPPGSANWAIGCTGRELTRPMPFTHSPQIPEGYVDHNGAPVAPASLYLAQLRQRLGNTPTH
jgi:hypothetical protein